MFTHEVESARGLVKMKEFSRSQPVTYTVNVVLSLKRCQIESLILMQATNSK